MKDSSMVGGVDSIFKTPVSDGIALLPKKPGIYAMLNRVTRKYNIGQSWNMYKRCVVHRNQLITGCAANMRMRRDAEIFGADVYFYFALELIELGARHTVKLQLNQLEIWWVVQLQAHDERFGYVSEAGHHRTLAARFRERERKLLRQSSGKYELLANVDINDPIAHELLMSWIPGS